MGFYEQIAEYYDYIFPVSMNTVVFISNATGAVPKAILDVACGTGGYSIELAKRGYDITAVDIDSKMIEGLKQKNVLENEKVNFLQANMLELGSKLSGESFDSVFCIGNSLVHLDNNDQIKNFFLNVRKILKPGGAFLIQIINFDRIIIKDIKALPTIVNDDIGLTFERLYRLDKELNKIFFKTVLKVNDQKIQNEIPLTPILQEEIVALLKSSGFEEVNTYGDFKLNAFDKENSYVLVIEAK